MSYTKQPKARRAFVSDSEESESEYEQDSIQVDLPPSSTFKRPMSGSRSGAATSASPPTKQLNKARLSMLLGKNRNGRSSPVDMVQASGKQAKIPNTFSVGHKDEQLQNVIRGGMKVIDPAANEAPANLNYVLYGHHQQPHVRGLIPGGNVSSGTYSHLTGRVSSEQQQKQMQQVRAPGSLDNKQHYRTTTLNSGHENQGYLSRKRKADDNGGKSHNDSVIHKKPNTSLTTFSTKAPLPTIETKKISVSDWDPLKPQYAVTAHSSPHIPGPSLYRPPSSNMISKRQSNPPQNAVRVKIEGSPNPPAHASSRTPSNVKNTHTGGFTISSRTSKDNSTFPSSKNLAVQTPRPSWLSNEPDSSWISALGHPKSLTTTTKPALKQLGSQTSSARCKEPLVQQNSTKSQVRPSVGDVFVSTRSETPTPAAKSNTKHEPLQRLLATVAEKKAKTQSALQHKSQVEKNKVNVTANAALKKPEMTQSTSHYSQPVKVIVDTALKKPDWSSTALSEAPATRSTPRHSQPVKLIADPVPTFKEWSSTMESKSKPTKETSQQERPAKIPVDTESEKADVRPAVIPEKTTAEATSIRDQPAKVTSNVALKNPEMASAIGSKNNPIKEISQPEQPANVTSDVVLEKPDLGLADIPEKTKTQETSQLDQAANVTPDVALKKPESSSIAVPKESTTLPRPKPDLPAEASSQSKTANESVPEKEPGVIYLPPVSPLPEGAEPYFEYSLYQQLYIPFSPPYLSASTAPTTDILKHRFHSAGAANAEAERVFTHTRDQYTQFFSMHFSQWKSTRTPHGCLVFSGKFSPHDDRHKEIHITVGVRRDWVSEYGAAAMMTVTPLGQQAQARQPWTPPSPLFQTEVYIVRLNRLLHMNANHTGTGYNIERVSQPLPCNEIYTTLDDANWAARNLTVKLGRIEKPKCPETVQDQKEMVRRLNDQAIELQRTGGCWREQFLGRCGEEEYWDDVEVVVEKVTVCGPRN